MLEVDLRFVTCSTEVMFMEIEINYYGSRNGELYLLFLEKRVDLEGLN